MKNITKAFVLILAVCSILAGCSTTEPADSAYVVVPVVPAASASSAAAAVETVKPEEKPAEDPLKLKTGGIAEEYSVNAMGLDFHIFTLSSTQIAMKYPSDVKVEEMRPAAEIFAEKYTDLLKDAVLAIDEENAMAVLTFPAAVNESVLKAFEKDLAEFIPAYVSSYAASNPMPVEHVEIKMPENKAVNETKSVPAPAATAPAAAAPAAAAPAPAAEVKAGPAPEAVPAKSNAGTIILVVVVSIIVIACIVYFVNRRKEQ